MVVYIYIYIYIYTLVFENIIVRELSLIRIRNIYNLW
jgi:hypothetical protein